MLPDGKFMATVGGRPGATSILVGVHGEDSPAVIARKLVREQMADVLAWLDKPPNMLTGSEVIDKLAGRPVWSAKGVAEPAATPPTTPWSAPVDPVAELKKWHQRLKETR